jgi:hypothetical protein
VYLESLSRTESNWNFLYIIRPSPITYEYLSESKPILRFSPFRRFFTIFFVARTGLVSYFFCRSPIAILLRVKLSLKMKLSKQFNIFYGTGLSTKSLGNLTD